MSDNPNVCGLDSRAVFNDDGVTVAMVRVTRDGVTVNWLPDFFAFGVPGEVKAEIVARLRFHADKLESGETEQHMKKYRDVNKRGDA